MNQKIKTFVDTYVEEYDQRQRPVWNYEDGCLLLGMQYLYEATGELKYLDCVRRFMDRYIGEEGSIRYYEPKDYNLDKVTNGRALFFLYRETGEERYKKALDLIYSQLETHPRTDCGNFWHKQIYPYQIWLDGLYMGQPLYLEYTRDFQEEKHYEDITAQFLNVRKYLYNKEKQLYLHAYDEKKQMPWADKTTGCSHNYWLRSMGWYLMALVDCYGLMPEEEKKHRETYLQLFKETLTGLLKYQEPKTKLFYQLVDMPELEGNYLETSGSVMVAYSILKACRLGMLSTETCRKVGEDILEGILQEKLVTADDGIHLTDICLVAGLGPGNERDGSVAYYLSEPIVSDEEKAVGVLMMAFSEFLKINRPEN